MSDINRHPIWYFPMDETVDDELTIRPLESLNPAKMGRNTQYETQNDAEEIMLLDDLAAEGVEENGT